MLLKEFTSLFLKHTKPTRNHLTPELMLRLVTTDCPLWSAPVDHSPFKDPFWAFYWPGGQAIARYILDNSESVKNYKILDVGCGCGAGALAAAKVNAKLVVANDIDKCALYATKINADLNDLQVQINSVNLIGNECHEFDMIVIGDMFYDEDFAKLLFDWLTQLSKNKTVLIGDPGRHGLTDRKRNQMRLLAQYEMPKISCKENNGFTHTTVWTLK